MLSTKSHLTWPLGARGSALASSTTSGLCELRPGDISIIPQNEVSGPKSRVRPPPARPKRCDLRQAQRIGRIVRRRVLQFAVKAAEEDTVVVGSGPYRRHHTARAGP